ncbi:MAG TPA: hypothetical protein EYP07_03020, partial [Kiloniellaceae bacterium]|nr:hypothetical protein [Kiloniellaceae bacterium]
MMKESRKIQPEITPRRRIACFLGPLAATLLTVGMVAQTQADDAAGPEPGFAQCREAPVADCAKVFLAAALAELDSIAEPAQRSMLLQDVANSFAWARDFAAARAVLQRIEDPGERDFRLAFIVEIQSRSGDGPGAVETARSIADPQRRINSLVQVASEGGLPAAAQAAKASAAEIEDPGSR